MTLAEFVIGFLIVAAVTSVIAAKDHIAAAVSAAWTANQADFPVTEVDRGEIR